MFVAKCFALLKNIRIFVNIDICFIAAITYTAKLSTHRVSNVGTDSTPPHDEY